MYIFSCVLFHSQGTINGYNRANQAEAVFYAENDISFNEGEFAVHYRLFCYSVCNIFSWIHNKYVPNMIAVFPFPNGKCSWFVKVLSYHPCLVEKHTFYWQKKVWKRFRDWGRRKGWQKQTGNGHPWGLNSSCPENVGARS